MNQNLKSGDRIKALPGTITEVLSYGQIGVVAEVRDPKGYSGNNSNNLVRWGAEEILMGFTPEDVTKIEGDSNDRS